MAGLFAFGLLSVPARFFCGRDATSHVDAIRKPYRNLTLLARTRKLSLFFAGETA
jgi:hypothetical protein